MCFSSRPRIFHAGRNARHEIDEPDVEKRRPDLDGMGHGHPVSLGRQEIMAQEDLVLQILRPGQQIPPPEIGGERSGQVFGRGIAADPCPQLLREELLDPGGVVPAHEMGEQRDPPGPPDRRS